MYLEALAHWPMWVSLGAVVLTIVVYTLDRWSMELVSISVIAALLLVFSLPGATALDGSSISPSNLLSGFSNPALITIMALLVVGQGLFHTGALEAPTRALIKSYNKRPTVTILTAFLAVFMTSALTNNTPVVIMFLPIMSALAGRMGASTSKLMMPLSFVSIMAGMTTLIGTSTNLLAADGYKRITGEQLGFFDQTEFGLILAAIGGLYLLIASRYILPDREGFAETMVRSGKQFVAQFEVTPGHFLDGNNAVAGMFPRLGDMTIRLIQRGEKAILPPYDDLTLIPGDIVIVAATRQALTDLLSGKPDLLRDIWGSDFSESEGETDEEQLGLVEAIIAPGSRMAGRTVEMLGFRRLTQAVTLGIQRRSRMIRSHLGQIRLEAGDTLLLCGPVSAFRDLRSNRDLILLEWSQSEFPITNKAIFARIITLGMVIAAASGLVSIVVASVLAATSMVVFRCLNHRQAGRALDLKIYLIIAAALAMGTSLEATGAASLIANAVVDVSAPLGPYATLSAIFLVVALMTNIISNAATSVLFTPIAMSAADLVDADRFPFLLAVIFASNCSFATPIAYQTNMLVMGPGHYKFGDFLKFGGPLILLMWAAFSIIAPLRFDL